jgi:GNAT superfamily N-acetyltransferase
VTVPPEILFRPARPADLPACEEIWRDGLNDYLLPLGQMEIPPDNASLRLLHGHALATDPELFWVATEATAGREEVVAFASAVRRESVWFLSMLFVRPGRQLGGLGRALLERTLPLDGAVTRAVATDPAQPISNGLYASFGMVPRLPMFNIVGRATRPETLVALPDGILATRLDAPSTGQPNPDTDVEVAALDREVLGFAHPEDHEFLRRQGRIRFDYRDSGGRLLGYGYTSGLGRLGPVAVRDDTLQAPLVADLLAAVPPRGASAMWVPGAAGATMEMLVRAGYRIEGFPVLLCWSRPFADFGRYLPIGPGLL